MVHSIWLAHLNNFSICWCGLFLVLCIWIHVKSKIALVWDNGTDTRTECIVIPFNFRFPLPNILFFNSTPLPSRYGIFYLIFRPVALSILRTTVPCHVSSPTLFFDAHSPIWLFSFTKNKRIRLISQLNHTKVK